LAGLWTDSDQFRKVLYKIDGKQVTIRGILDDNKSETQDLVLPLDGNNIQLYKTENQLITIGTVDTTKNVLTLCSRTYGRTCDLNYVADTKELAIGLSQSEYERDDSVPPYSWHSVTVGGYGVDFSIPDLLGGKVDVRMHVGGVTTNPLRFSLNTDGSISYQGRKVGSATAFTFCSGDTYRDICRSVVSGENFYIIFKASKS